MAKQWRVRVAKYFERLRELDTTTEEMSVSLVRGASRSERWGHKSSRLAMLLGKCRSLESFGPLEPDGPCGYEAEAFELLKTWPSLEAIEIHQCFPLSFGDMCTRTFGFAKDTGQFKGILKAVIHDVDELVYDEDAGGEVPLQFTIQRDFSKNEKRPLRWCDKEEELDLPPY